jgi:hypothetical protein
VPRTWPPFVGIPETAKRGAPKNYERSRGKVARSLRLNLAFTIGREFGKSLEWLFADAQYRRAYGLSVFLSTYHGGNLLTLGGILEAAIIR